MFFVCFFLWAINVLFAPMAISFYAFYEIQFPRVYWGWTAGFLNLFLSQADTSQRRLINRLAAFLTHCFSSAVFFHLRVYSELRLQPPNWRSWKRLWTAGCWTFRSTQQTLTPSQVSSPISSNLLPWQPDYLRGKKSDFSFWIIFELSCRATPSK